MGQHISDDLIRRRAHAIWEAEGRPEGLQDEHWRRARDELEQDFQKATAGVPEHEHRWTPHLEVEEALEPGKNREPAGLKWTSGSGERGPG